MSAEAKQERDPRVDPRSGDIWMKGESPFVRKFYEVLERDPRLMSSDVSVFVNSSGYEFALSADQFRKWAAGATVIRSSEGEK